MMPADMSKSTYLTFGNKHNRPTKIYPPPIDTENVRFQAQEIVRCCSEVSAHRAIIRQESLRASKLCDCVVVMSSSSELFSPDLLPISSTQPSTQSSALQKFSLPPGYTIRPLRRTDYATGMLDVLRVLTTVGEVSESAWLERFDYMHKSAPGTYYVLVVCDDSEKVVGTGAVVVERKL